MVAFSHFAFALCAVGGSFAAPVAETPDFELSSPTSLVRRQDYNQDYETTGTVDYSPSSNGYSVSFSGAADFVVGKGWKTGTSRSISFSGSTSAKSGTVLLSVYGWTKSPLVEYYIQEYNTGSGSSGTLMGSVTCDGSSYEIWKHTQVNQPSIVGTTTFVQYISKRASQRSGSGTVTTKCHFDAWAKLGMNLGTFDYQTLATEGWGGASGSSKYTISAS